MRPRMALALLIAVFMVSCVTTRKLDTSKPVQMVESGLGTDYRQDGQPLSRSDLEDALEAHPAAGPKMSGYQAKKWMGVLFGGVGGGLVGHNVATNLTASGDKDWTLSLVGAGLMAIGLPFGLIAEGQFRSAVEAYNGGFMQAQAPGEVVPFLSILAEPERSMQCLAGMRMSF